MNKTGIFLSSMVYLSASLFTIFSLSSCSHSTKVAKVVPVEITAEVANANTQTTTDDTQVVATSSGPFQIEKATSETVSQSRAPASVVNE